MCCGLTSVDIPDGVTSIGYEAFRNCNRLTEVKVKPVSPPSSLHLVLNTINQRMVTLVLDGVNDANDLPEAIAAGKLSKHHYKKLIPSNIRLGKNSTS